MVYKQLGILSIILLVALIVSPPSTADAQDDVSWLLERINALRASTSAPGYALNSQLSAAAYQHSEYMAATCHVSHTQSNGSTPTARARANGYTGSRIGENIYGRTNARAADAWNFWTNSPVHYAGLINRNTNEIGIGVAHGACGHYYTLVFGHRDDVTAPPAPAVAPPVESGDAAAPPPPTQAPYVPPPPTRTPTATIPTLTPSATWTITPTYTVSPTSTVRPPTETPLILPTVPVPDQATSVALALSPDEAAIPSPMRTVIPPAPTEAAANRSGVPADDDGFEARNLIPFALIGQVVLIGVAGFVVFRRSR